MSSVEVKDTELTTSGSVVVFLTLTATTDARLFIATDGLTSEATPFATP